MLNEPVTELVFEGLDTHATIYLNGKVLGHANNSHREWVFPFKGLATNTLRIDFRSAVDHDLEAERVMNETYGIVLPFNYSHSRKPAYQYGWDWGPRLVSAGIWKDAYVRAYSNIRIDSVLFRTPDVTDTRSVKVLGKVTVEIPQGTPGYPFILTIRDHSTYAVVYQSPFLPGQAKQRRMLEGASGPRGM